MSAEKKNGYWQKTWLQALLATGLILIISIFVAWYNNRVVPGSTSPLAHYPASLGNPLRFLAEWDSRYFTGISQHGYVQPSDPAFFPLYPIAIKIVSFIIPSPLMAGLLISWASLFGAIYFYLKIVSLLWRVNTSEKLQASLFFILFPTAMFMLTVYSEALFVFLSLAALYFCLKKQYWISVPFLIGASATRVTGVFTIMLICLLMLEQKQSIKKTLVVGLAGMSGLLAYSVFLQVKFHNFLQYVAAEKYWGRFGQSYIESMKSSASLLNLLMTVLILASVYYWFERKRYSFALYSFAFLAVPAVTGSLISLNRFALADFPIMFMLFSVSRKRPAIQSILLCITAIFWTYFLLQFAGGYNGG